MANGRCTSELLLLLILVHSSYIVATVSNVKCYCSPCPDYYINDTCEVVSGGKCFTSVEYDTDGSEEWSYGCLAPPEGGGVIFSCKGSTVPHESPKAIECCDEKDFCNLDLEPTPGTDISIFRSSRSREEVTKIICSIMAVLAIFVISAAILMCLRCRRQNRCAKFFKGKDDCLTFESEVQNINEVVLGVSSGSGSGVPLLVERSCAKEITMLHKIGKGRYGEVYKASWRGQDVAVKTFFSMEETSFRKEHEIYATDLLRHENILGFIIGDIKGNGSWTQLMLITDYHKNGSLYDFINLNILDLNTLLKMALSIVSGLSFLHAEMRGIKKKPSIVHRDIKSKNILVKDDLTCCIADFGLALKLDKDSNHLRTNLNMKQGTRRYMAPEVLDETMDTSLPESFRMADMYSTALVFWEMVRRCDACGTPEEYQAPYFDVVGGDPSFEEMRKVVCIEGYRPGVPKSWQQNETIGAFVSKMMLCWSSSASKRISSLGLRNFLAKLNGSLTEEKRRWLHGNQHFGDDEDTDKPCDRNLNDIPSVHTASLRDNKSSSELNGSLTDELPSKIQLNACCALH